MHPNIVALRMTEITISLFVNGVFNNASNCPESCLIFFILKMAIQNANNPDEVTQIPGAAQFKYLISKEITFDKGIEINKWSSIGNIAKTNNNDIACFLRLSQSRYSRIFTIIQDPHQSNLQTGPAIGKY
jgi:hypothetical protein